MFEILIVDDDRIILEGLYHMVERFAAGKTIHLAENGNEAFEAVCSRRIGMIFTDIKMPVCDGLELLEKLKNIDFQGETVIISGFDDYSFVRKAMKMGASDYLLKPVTTDSLEATFLDCEKRLRLKKLHEQEADHGTLRHLYSMQAQLEALMTGRDQPELLRKNGLCGNCYVAVFAANFYNKNKLTDIEKQAVVLMLQDKVNECAGKDLLFLQGEFENRWLGVLLGNSKELAKVLPSLREQLTQKGLRIGFDTDIRPFDQLRNSYESALKNLEQFFYDLAPVATKESVEDIQNTLVTAMAGYDNNKLTAAAELFFGKLTADRVSIQQCKQLTASIIYAVMKINNRYIGVVGQYKFTDYDLVLAIQEAATLSSLKKQFLLITGVYMGDILEKEQLRDDGVIRKAKQLVAEGYQGNLTVKEVAESVGLHPNYFSTLFRQKTGETFSDYLRTVRIHEATRLMSQSNMKIYEVGPKVGYTDTTHFYRAFKQVTGFAPGRFKKQTDS